MTHTALLAIDVQESFKQRDYWQETDFTGYAERQNQLIGAARQQNWPVIFVLHNEAQGVFSPASGFVRLMDFIDQQADDPIFNKHVHNALLGSGLHEWLQARDITRLVISGIRTEQCCETTTRVASDLGYKVEFVLDATLTFPMVHPHSGDTVSAAAIQAHTALVLEKRFASIRKVADYL